VSRVVDEQTNDKKMPAAESFSHNHDIFIVVGDRYI
jgi:hypothetical protein